MARAALKQKQAQELKEQITITHQELREAYEGWVDGVLANPKGFLSKRAVKIFMDTVDSFANGYLDIALELINIATINGYRDATWAINKYNEELRKNIGATDRNSLVNTSQKRVRVSDEVF